MTIRDEASDSPLHGCSRERLQWYSISPYVVVLTKAAYHDLRRRQNNCSAACDWQFQAGTSVSWTLVAASYTYVVATEVISIDPIKDATVTSTIGASLPAWVTPPMTNSLGTQVVVLGNGKTV
jgi:hypothetical protein